MGEPGEPGQKGRQVRSPQFLWLLTPGFDPQPLSLLLGLESRPTLFFLHRETLASKAPSDSQDPRQVSYPGLGSGKGKGGREVSLGEVSHALLGGIHSPVPVAKEEKHLYSLKVTPKLCIQSDPSSVKHVFRTNMISRHDAATACALNAGSWLSLPPVYLGLHCTC